MKIVFMGTPDFAVPSLIALSEKYDVEAVFTQPDKPKGRGKKLCFSEVKDEALCRNIPVYQPVKLKDNRGVIDKIKQINPDFIIVVAFGQILTKEILDIPKYGCINLHGSILPMYRGAAPINWAIIKGEKVSGNTTMLMNEGLDTGDILMQDKVEIDKDMTAGELYNILKVRGADLLIKTIEGICSGKITPKKQNGETFYAKMLDKKNAVIDWNNTASDINNFIRGLNPWPIAYTTYENKKMKIFKAEALNEKSDKDPGTIISSDKNGLKVACQNSILLVKEIQFPNGKTMTVKQYINGHKFDEDYILK